MPFQPGDSVSYFVKNGGMRTGVVGSVGEDYVRVLDGFGGSTRLSLRDAVEVNDGRMTRLRILDSEAPQEANEVRARYLKDWIANAEKNAKAMDDEKPKVRAQKASKAVENDGLSEQVISIVLSADGPLGKKDIIAALGEEPKRWNEVIEAALRSGKIVRTGKKRGTKYSRKDS